MARRAPTSATYDNWPKSKTVGQPQSGIISLDPEDQIQATRAAQIAAGTGVTGTH